MSKEIRRVLNDGLYNAGILGFLRVLNKGLDRDFNRFTSGNAVVFYDSDLETFDQFYFKTLVDTYEKDTVFFGIMEHHEKLLGINELNDASSKIVDEAVKFLVEKGKRPSYESAYSILSEKGILFDFSEALSKLKRIVTQEEKKHLAIEIMEEMRKNCEVFLLKDIAYTRIQPFWKNMSFLLKTENKTDFYQAYNKSFLAPVKNFLSDTRKIPKKGLECCQCNSLISSKEAGAMSWINDEGIDVNRKTSHYWDHNPDSFLCPICSLIYSCIPLGFFYSVNQGIFVNQNQSVERLANYYSSFSLRAIANDVQDPFYTIVKKLILEMEAEQAVNQIKNIQVLRRKNDQYYSHFFSKDMLRRLKNCKDLLERIVKIYYLRNTDYISVFDEVLQRLLRNENLYSFMGGRLRDCIVEGRNPGFIIALLKIQIIYFEKGDVNMALDITSRGQRDGFFLKKSMAGDDKNENKIRGLSFKLMNALKSKNEYAFSDILFRQYFAEGKPIPKDIIEILGNEKNFLNYGTAFVSGLNSYEKNEENSQK